MIDCESEAHEAKVLREPPDFARAPNAPLH